jgi:hypothetical protein
MQIQVCISQNVFTTLKKGDDYKRCEHNVIAYVAK